MFQMWDLHTVSAIHRIIGPPCHPKTLPAGFGIRSKATSENA